MEGTFIIISLCSESSCSNSNDKEQCGFIFTLKSPSKFNKKLKINHYNTSCGIMNNPNNFENEKVGWKCTIKWIYFRKEELFMFLKLSK